MFAKKPINCWQIIHRKMFADQLSNQRERETQITFRLEVWCTQSPERPARSHFLPINGIPYVWLRYLFWNDAKDVIYIPLMRHKAKQTVASSVTATLCSITIPSTLGQNRRFDPARKCLCICVPVYRCIDALSWGISNTINKSHTIVIKTHQTDVVEALTLWHVYSSESTFLCLLILMSMQFITEELDSVLQTLISLHFLELNASLCGHAAEKTEGEKKARTFSVEIKRL